jgi:hypothetical protein
MDWKMDLKIGSDARSQQPKALKTIPVSFLYSDQ